MNNGVLRFIQGPQAQRLKAAAAPVLSSSPELVRLLSWLSRDMLVLQGLAACSGGGSIAYLRMKQPVGWQKAVRWQYAFVTINTAQTLRLLHERRPVPLTDAEAAAYKSIFEGSMLRSQFRALSREAGMEHVFLPPGA
jgi:hypothetical protein